MCVSLLELKYGFDEKFFLLFKNNVNAKSSSKAWYEIFLRESINVNLQTLTYSGWMSLPERLKIQG